MYHMLATERNSLWRLRVTISPPTHVCQSTVLSCLFALSVQSDTAVGWSERFMQVLGQTECFAFFYSAYSKAFVTGLFSGQPYFLLRIRTFA